MLIVFIMHCRILFSSLSFLFFTPVCPDFGIKLTYGLSVGSTWECGGRRRCACGNRQKLMNPGRPIIKIEFNFRSMLTLFWVHCLQMGIHYKYADTPGSDFSDCLVLLCCTNGHLLSPSSPVCLSPVLKRSLEGRIMGRISVILVVVAVIAVVLAVASIAEASSGAYRKPPFNGSIFGKRNSGNSSSLSVRLELNFTWIGCVISTLMTFYNFLVIFQMVQEVRTSEGKRWARWLLFVKSPWKLVLPSMWTQEDEATPEISCIMKLFNPP